MTSGGPGRLSSRLPHGGRYHAIQALPGIGPVLAAVIVAEIGDITRFATLARLCSWAGLTPGTEPELSRLAELGEGQLAPHGLIRRC
jgi:transposase